MAVCTHFTSKEKDNKLLPSFLSCNLALSSLGMRHCLILRHLNIDTFREGKCEEMLNCVNRSQAFTVKRFMFYARSQRVLKNRFTYENSIKREIIFLWKLRYFQAALKP